MTSTNAVTVETFAALVERLAADATAAHAAHFALPDGVRSTVRMTDEMSSAFNYLSQLSGAAQGLVDALRAEGRLA